jgi:hypothetical protein
MICPTGRTKYFLLEGWTVKSALMALGKFDFWRGFANAVSSVLVIAKCARLASPAMTVSNPQYSG